MAMSLPEENRICQLSTACRNAIEVAQWATSSCSRPLPATDNGVRYAVDPIDWLHPYHHGQYPLSAFVHNINRCSLCWDRPCNLQHAKQPHCLCGHAIHLPGRRRYHIISTLCSICEMFFFACRRGQL